MQRAMLDLARRRSIRLVGPNCLGLMANQPDISLDATFSGSVPPPGGLAVASQSGGVGIVLSDVARSMGLGVGSFVSLGNKADVSSNDLLAAWRDDPRVTAAALYLESFGNAPKFARFARRFAERKPLLAVVGGRSAAAPGRRVAHGGRGVTGGRVDALFAQAGVIACDGAEDLAETAPLLGGAAAAARPRLGVLSNAGGMGVLAADCADEHGLVVPELSERLPRPGLSATCSAPPARATRSTPAPGASPARWPRSPTSCCAPARSTRSWSCWSPPASATSRGRPCAGSPGPRRPPLPPVVLVPMGGSCGRPGGVDGITAMRSTDGGRPLARPGGTVRRVAAAGPPGPRARGPRPRERARALADAPARRASVEAGSRGWLSIAEVRVLVADYDLAPVGELATTRSRPRARRPSWATRWRSRSPTRDVLHRDRAAGPGRAGLAGRGGRRGARVRARRSAATASRSWCSRSRTASRSRWACSATRASGRSSWSPPAAPRRSCGPTGSSCCRRCRAATRRAPYVRCGSGRLLDGFRGSPRADVGLARAPPGAARPPRRGRPPDRRARPQPGPGRTGRRDARRREDPPLRRPPRRRRHPPPAAGPLTGRTARYVMPSSVAAARRDEVDALRVEASDELRGQLGRVGLGEVVVVLEGRAAP